jgi:hypothetical protein
MDSKCQQVLRLPQQQMLDSAEFFSLTPSILISQRASLDDSNSHTCLLLWGGRMESL